MSKTFMELACDSKYVHSPLYNAIYRKLILEEDSREELFVPEYLTETIDTIRIISKMEDFEESFSIKLWYNKIMILKYSNDPPKIEMKHPHLNWTDIWNKVQYECLDSKC